MTAKITAAKRACWTCGLYAHTVTAGTCQTCKAAR